MPIVYYTAILDRDGAGELGVTFPDFPGCVTGGADMADAARHAEEALSLHISDMIDTGEPIPVPTPAEAIPVVEGEPEVARLLVRADLPGKSVRVNVSFEEGLLGRIDAAAGRAGLSRSAFLADAARSRLVG